MHKAAKKGFTINGYKYKGYNQLLKEINWHISNNIFNLTKEIVENKGKLTIDDSFINL